MQLTASDVDRIGFVDVTVGVLGGREDTRAGLAAAHVVLGEQTVR